MATEQPKNVPTTTPTTTEHPYPPVVPYPQAFNGPFPSPVPHGAYPPPFFAYPPNPDGSHPENGQNGAPPGPPYMMAFPAPPPGMVYAFPSAPGYPVPQPPAVPTALSRPKRKQVKMACTNCAQACKRCDESRPCERCMKYGLSDSCVDGQRKERKKGIKRGPYRRKAKNPEGTPSQTEGDWNPSTHSPANPTTTAAAIHAVAQFVTPEGYYSVFYPPPGHYITHPHEGQPGQEGAPPPHPNGPPIMPYYMHPGAFPPYPYAPHAAIYPPPPQPGPPPSQQQQPPSGAQTPQGTPQPPGQATPNAQASALPQTLNPTDVTKKADEMVAPPTNGTTAPGATTGPDVILSPSSTVTVIQTPTTKKRPRGAKSGDSKAKKAKAARAKSAKEGEGAASVGDAEEGEGDDATATTDG